MSSLTIVLLALGALTLFPESEKQVPASDIELDDVQMTLYPKQDPDQAVWYFRSQHVAYNPDLRESTLINITDGARTVDRVADFTITSPEITIDQFDNLHGDAMDIHLIEANWKLDMRSLNGRQVLIDQQKGKFEVPLLMYRGTGLGESRDENVRMNFDLTEFEALCANGSCNTTIIVDE